MLKITVPRVEGFDEVRNMFVDYIPETTLQLEHSLLSLSKWEAKWKKPFLSQNEDNPRTQEEMIDYIRCMTLNTVDPKVYDHIPSEVMAKIIKYIEDPMTATTFSDNNKKNSREIITSEIIYYWMISLTIPFECQKWHLNRLLALIRVCSIKNQPPKKMSAKEIMTRNKALNAQRRAKLNTRG